MIPRRVLMVAPILFVSGLCSLVYQVAWLRDFRQIFGSSTAASAAVVAIFIGGLGLGGLVIGRRSDRHAKPFALYAQIELLIALAAAVTPGLLLLARAGYIALGGSTALGSTLGTITRLLFATLVLLIPTFLMGGIIPTAVRAVQTDEDPSRRSVAILYGLNTLGAVTGALLANFLLLEVFGTRVSLWMACLVNLLIAMIARALARTMLAEPVSVSEPETSGSVLGASAPPWFVYTAAAIVGFAFFLMELVWYRMLGPLLGGTVFTFGLILAFALLGIGIGSVMYAVVVRDGRLSIRIFALTCILEAAFIALPFALGDKIAILALQLRSLGVFGFAGYVAGWSVVTAIVVLPAAIIAGFQFPLLIGLIGRGRRDVGMQTGVTYAWNTLGAITGSLAGGFGLIAVMTAPGAWRATCVLLVMLGIGTLLLSAMRERRIFGLVPQVALVVVVVVMLMAEGPTAFWRHNPIGAGRSHLLPSGDPQGMRDVMHGVRRGIYWEAEGIESSIAVDDENGFGFIVNGKADGNSASDAPTQVMLGMVGAILHENPRSALVIGLGTGSSAGWLASVPEMERVDVVELEPTMLDVARLCEPVNKSALDNPKMQVRIGDAREVLLTSSEMYDLIASEPSNPYRAGVASLFTREYYRAIDKRLAEDGLLLQWVQAYEVDAMTVRTIIATIESVFPVVEMWELRRSDLLLVASRKQSNYDVNRLRGRLEQEPYRSAIRKTWRVKDLEGFLGHYVAGPTIASKIGKAQRGVLNTDDQTLIEFRFARKIGINTQFSIEEVTDVARAHGASLPTLTNGKVDPEGIAAGQLAIATMNLSKPKLSSGMSEKSLARMRVHANFLDNKPKGALEVWRRAGLEPITLIDSAILAMLLAMDGDSSILDLLEQLRDDFPCEADTALAHWHRTHGRYEEATNALVAAFFDHRNNPWAWPGIMAKALAIVPSIAMADETLGLRLFEALEEPFSVHLLNGMRLSTRFEIAQRIDVGEQCVKMLAPWEPHVPWLRHVLQYRTECYAKYHHEHRNKAKDDLDRFFGKEPIGFGSGLVFHE